MTAANDNRKTTMHVVRDEPETPILKQVEITPVTNQKKEGIETAKTKKNKKDDRTGRKLPPQPRGYISYPDYDCL